MARMARKGASGKGLTRRQTLRAGLAAVGAGIARGLLPRSAGAQAGPFNWRRFAGSTIFVQFTKNPWSTTMEQMLPEFEKQTGIKVEFSDLPEIQARQKLTVEFTAGGSGIDAWYTSLHVEKRRFWKAGWYASLNKFLTDPALTAPDYDWDDFTGGARQAVTQPDGTISALPAFVDPWVLFYRKDLFQAKGLQPPRTLEEMERLAKLFHDPPRMYGFVARGLKNANAPAWDWVLFSMGGTFLTKEGKPSLTTKESVAAMDYYARMLRTYAPPGVVNFNWYECSAAFMQGQVAMYFDGVNFASQFEDPSKSTIAGKVGYTLLPGGPGGRFSPIFSNGLAISAQSKRQGPAYIFCQWATTKQSAIRELLAGVGSGRASVWNDPTVKAQAKMPPDWAQAYVESLKIGRLGLPEIVGVTEYRDIIGVAIQKAIEGQDSSAVLAQAQREFQDLLNRTEG